jgi:hydrogenase maturation protease
VTAVLCIGVGNMYRCDDGVGWYVARLVREAEMPCVDVLEMSGEGAALMDAWSREDHVILVDAVSSGAAPGTLFEIDVHAQAIPADLFAFSTHAFGVAEAVEMARVLGELPDKLLIYGIEGACFDNGVGLTPAVEATAHQIVRLIDAEGVRLYEPGGTN